MRRIFGPRAGLSSVLIVGALVLVGAIVVGNSMGNSVLGQIGSRPLASVPSPFVPTAAPSDAERGQANWKKTQVMAVATDPGFPDPRVTPEPPPPETPRPRPRSTASPSPRPRDTFDLSTEPTLSPSTGPSGTLYTSPPLPIPITTHLETPTPDGEISPTPRPSGRGTPARFVAPTLPPVPYQTLNP